MRNLKKIASLFICLTIILSMSLNVTAAFAAEGYQFDIALIQPDGQPVDCNVIIRDLIGNWADKTLNRNDAGAYSITGLSQGDYNLWAVPYYGQYAASAKTLISIDSAGQLTAVNGNPVNEYTTINLIASETKLSGSVFLPDGVTLADARIQVFKVIEQNGYTWYEQLLYTFTPDSVYRIGGLDPGKYRIQAYPNSDSEYLQSGEFDFIVNSDGTYVNLDGSSLTTKDLYFRDSQLVIQILDPDGYGYQAYAELIVLNFEHNSCSSFSSQSGNICRASGFGDGTYYIRLRPFDGPFTASAEHSITIQGGVMTQLDGQDVQGSKQFTVSLTNPQVSCTIYSADMQVEPNSFVNLYQIAGDQKVFQYNAHTYTGHISLGGMSPGCTYTVMASSNNGIVYPSDEITIQIDESGNATPNEIELILKEPVTETPQFSAVINDSQGNPVTADCVLQYSILEGNGGNTYSYWTNGKLGFYGLPDGKYQFRATAWGNYLSQENTASMPQLVEVQNGVITRVNGREFAGEDLSFTLLPAQLTVAVNGASGEPIPDVNIWVNEIMPDYPRYQFSVVTNGEGTAYIGGLELGKQYSLKANSTFESGYVSSDSYTFSIDENGNYSGQNPLEVTLPQSQLQVNILNPDLSPNEAADLLLYDQNNTEISLDHTSFPLMNMRKIGGLADGNYSIRAYSYDGMYTPSYSYTFTIENGDVIKWNNEAVLGEPVFDVSLTNPQVTGTVNYQDLDGNYFAYLEVYEVNSSGWNRVFGIPSNDGTFKAGGLKPSTTYAFVAHPSIYEYTDSESVYVSTDEYGNANPGNITLTLKRTVAQVRGTVTDKNGNPASGYIVRAWTPTGSQGFGSNGEAYEMFGLSDGDYTVRAIPGSTDNAASKPRYITIEGGILTEIDGVPCAPDASLDLQLSEVAFTGVVRETDGTTVPNAWVGLWEDGTNEIAYDVTADETGSFSLGGFEPNKKYFVVANGYPDLFCTDPAIITTDSQGLPTPGSAAIIVYRPQLYVNITDPYGNIVDENCNFALTGDSYSSNSTFIDGKLATWGLGDGTYNIRAVPYGPLASSGLTPSLPITIQIENGLLKTVNGQPASGNIVDMALTTPQLSVNVSDEGGMPVLNSIVAVFDEGRLDKPAGLAVFPDQSGIAAIGGLEAGKNYVVVVYPTDQAPYFMSEQYPITIDAEGKYAGVSPLNIVLRHYSPVQVDSENRIVAVSVDSSYDENTGSISATVESGVINDILSAGNTLKGKKSFDIAIKVSGPAGSRGLELLIPAASFKDIARNPKTGSLIIDSPAGSMTLDGKALDRIAKASGTDEGYVCISISEVDAEQYVNSLPKSNRNKVKGQIGNRPVYDFGIKAGDKNISLSSLNPVVTLPYTLGPNEKQKDIVILYLNDRGNLVIEKGCKYNKISQTVTFGIK